MLFLLANLAFAADPDLTVVGKVTSTAPIAPHDVWLLEKANGFAFPLPKGVDAQVCLAVTRVESGDFFEDHLCFLRGGPATPLPTGDATWSLYEAGTLLFAKPATAPPTTLSPADALTHGTPQQKADAIRKAADDRDLSLMDALIAAIADGTRVPTPQDKVGRPVGALAVDALLDIGATLDGVAAKDRPKGRFVFAPGAVDYDLHAAAVQKDWQDWWAAWKASGPQ